MTSPDPEPPDVRGQQVREWENAPIYCICCKPDINCFMMAQERRADGHLASGVRPVPPSHLLSLAPCSTAGDKLPGNEWFHGDCIRITEKMAKAIREWYCRECRGEGQAAGASREEERLHGRVGHGEQWMGGCGRSDCGLVPCEL